MSRRDEFVAASRAGREASVGDANPYSGQGVLARLWLRGYMDMLAQWRADAPARQAALREQNPR